MFKCFQFHNKDGAVSSISDDYSMPHWINLSFYSTNKKVAYSTFIPRIKLPPKKSSNDFFSDWVCSCLYISFYVYILYLYAIIFY